MKQYRENPVAAEALVAIIIINYNGLADTVECLQSLRLSTYRVYRVILVDNASRENPCPILERDFPEVCTVRSEVNLGFTGGNNLGLTAAYTFEPDYILFLNNDTLVAPDMLRELVRFMGSHPDTGMVGPLTYYYDEPDMVCFGGGMLNCNTGRISFLDRGVRLDAAVAGVRYCNFIEGAAMLIRTPLVKEIGGFNDVYFLTSEESELCTEVEARGYRLAVLNAAVMWHKVSRSMGAGSELINYFVYRNRLRFIRRNARNFRLRDFLAIALTYCRTFVSLLLRQRNLRAGRGLIMGVIDFLRGITGPGRYRQRLQPIRQDGVGLS